MSKETTKLDKYKLGKIDLSMVITMNSNFVVNLFSGMGAGPTSDFALFPNCFMSVKQYSEGLPSLSLISVGIKLLLRRLRMMFSKQL